MTRGSSNRKEPPSFAPKFRPNSSLVKVESIFINIVAAQQIKPEKCEHFTIRGFVSDIREHGKLYWPFSVNGDGAGSEEINSTLYPLHTPKYKSWRCQSCLNEIEVAAAAAKKDGHDISVKCSRQLKAKKFHSHRSLENVVTYLSEKLKQPPELGRTVCEGIKSASKFKHKQKQKLDSALHSITRGQGENEKHNAATGLTSNQHDSLTSVDEYQKESLRPPRTTVTKYAIVVGSRHNGRHLRATKFVQQQHDDSVGTGRRKSKNKKVRLLNEILEKDGKGAQPAMTKGFHFDESAKASCSASQILQKKQFDNMRCQAGQQRNNNCQEQDRNWSQMHYANSVDGNGERNAQGLHQTSNDGSTDTIIKQTDKMVLGREQRADGHKNYPDGSQRRKTDSCGRPDKLSTCRPFHGKVTDSLYNNSRSPHSQFKGKSNDTIHKALQGANMLAPSDNGKRLNGNNATQFMETIQIGQQTQDLPPMQDGNSSRRYYSFADGSLDPRKGTGHSIPGTENRLLRNDTVVYMGESSRACKSLVDKNTRNGTNSISALKRRNQGPCDGNKKPRHNGRTGGPVVHQSEFLLRNSNKKMCGMLGKPENALCEIRGNKMQEVGTSDDIPMEIVELMAKNQYERHLHEVRDDHYASQSDSYPNNDMVGRTNVLPNDVSRGPSHEKPRSPNAHIILEKNSGIANGKSSVNILQRPSMGSTHRPLLPSPRDLSGVLQFPTVGSSSANIFQIQNHKYDMNKMASAQRVLPRSEAQFELWQPISQQSDKTHRAWPMVPPNNPVHMPSALQGNTWQSFNVGKVPKFSSYIGEGRDISNLALAGKKTNNFMPEASHTSRPNRVDSKRQVMGSPDSYANEAIPAMHLLNLKNGRPQSSTPTNMDAVANRKTFGRSFSNDHLAKELLGNSFAVGKSSHKLKQPSPYGYQSKNPQSDASCKCSPPVPTLSSAVAPLHGDVGDKRGVPPSSHHQERAFLNVNPGGSLLPNDNRNIKYQKSRLTNTVGVAFQQLIPAHELANHIFSPSWSASGSSHLCIKGSFSGYHNSVAQESYETVYKRAELGVCCVNKNPMEFTMPGPGNEFMIGPEELKLRKPYPLNITRQMATNSLRQQDFIKYDSSNNRL